MRPDTGPSPPNRAPLASSPALWPVVLPAIRCDLMAMASYRHTHSSTAVLPCPCVSVVGERDHMVSVDDAAEWRLLFAAHSLAIVPGAGHDVYANPAHHSIVWKAVMQGLQARQAYASGGPLTVPAGAPRTLVEALHRAANLAPSRGVYCYEAAAASQDTPTSFTSYPSLLQAATLAASRLTAPPLSAHFGPGRRVVLQLPSLAAHFQCFWACVLTGTTPVTVAIPPSYRDSTNAVVTKLEHVWRALGEPPVIAASSNASALSACLGPAATVLRCEDLLAADDSTPPPPPTWSPSPEDVAFLQLTSGSTGTPKCIQETHSGVLAHCFSSAAFNDYKASDVTVNWLPVDHIVPILTIHIRDVVMCCTEVQVATQLVLQSPTLWLDVLHRHRGTHTWGPNFAFKMLADAARRDTASSWDVSSVKLWLNAGEQCTMSAMGEFLEVLGPAGVHPSTLQPSFGMAECGTCMTYATSFSMDGGALAVPSAAPSTTLCVLPTSAVSRTTTSFVDLGPVTPGFEIRIVADDNTLLPELRIGRFQIRGPSVTPGYLNNPEANAESFVGDGWFNSGDLGFMHLGRLYLTGRAKETIIVRGNNLFAHDIEAVVAELPGVRPMWVGCCEVRAAGAATESVGVCFVPAEAEAEGKAEGTEVVARLEEVCSRIRATVTQAFGVSPAIVLPVTADEFPKTTSGKIQRTTIKSKLAQALRHQEEEAFLLSQSQPRPPLPPIDASSPLNVPVWKLLDKVTDPQPSQHHSMVVFTSYPSWYTASSTLVCVVPDPDLDIAVWNSEESVWRVNPRDAEHLVQALQSAITSTAEPLLFINAWPAEMATSSPPSSAPSTPSSVAFTAVLRVYHAVAAISHQLRGPARLWTLTAGARSVLPSLVNGSHHRRQSVSWPPPVCTISQAAAHGASAAFLFEHPSLWGGVVDVDSQLSPRSSIFQAVRVLQSRWQTSEWAGFLANRGVEWYREELRPVAALPASPPHPLSSSSSSSSPSSPAARVLLTGALGGIGRLLIPAIVAHLSPQLIVLTCRRAEARDPAFVAGLRDASPNTTVMLHDCDLTDPSAVETLVRTVARRAGAALTHVFHLGGTIAEAPLAAPGENPSGVLVSRVDGTWNLLSALRQPLPVYARWTPPTPSVDGVGGVAVPGGPPSLSDDDTVVVLFSSLAASVGGIGMSAYGAACACQTQLVRAWRASGGKGVSIHWGPWADVGMAAGARWDLSKLGMEALAPSTLLPLVFQAVDREMRAAGDASVEWDAGVTVARIAWDRLLRHVSADAPGCLRRHPTAPELPSPAPRARRSTGDDVVPFAQRRAWESTSRPATERRIEATRALVECVRLIGDIGPSVRVHASSLWTALGIDSFSSVPLLRRLSALLSGQRLPPTFLYEHPSIDSVVTYALNAVPVPDDGAVLPPSPPPLSPPRPAPRSRPAARIAGVSAGAVSVVGVGCCLPGGITTPTEFWSLVVKGGTTSSPMPASRRRLGGVSPTDGPLSGSYLSQPIDAFDGPFFHLPPAECVEMDPQHRLTLQSVWHAMENAGITPSQLQPETVGVFLGVHYDDYRSIRRSNASLRGNAEDGSGGDGRRAHSAYKALGCAPSALSGRIAAFFGFHGPCMTLQTACSSSLVAVDMACRDLLSGRCTVAVVGGVQLNISSNPFEDLRCMGVLSPTAVCRPFSAHRDGLTRGEGVVTFLLTQQDATRHLQLRSQAVLLGSAVNNSGLLATPNPAAQAAVVEAALHNAGVSAQDIGYIEAHATATVLGDKAELVGLRKVFDVSFSPSSSSSSSSAVPVPLYIGSAKENVGHLEAAAGAVGLLRAILAVRHAVVPPQPSAADATAELPDSSRLRISPVAVDFPLPSADVPAGRVAGVSSFGLTGTNAHVVVAQPPKGDGGDISGDGSWLREEEEEEKEELVLFSAASELSLRRLLDSVKLTLDVEPPRFSLRSLACTASTRRAHLSHRAAFVASSLPDLVAAIDAPSVGSHSTSPGFLLRFSFSSAVPAGEAAEAPLRGVGNRLAELWATSLQAAATELSPEASPTASWVIAMVACLQALGLSVLGVTGVDEVSLRVVTAAAKLIPGVPLVSSLLDDPGDRSSGGDGVPLSIPIATSATRSTLLRVLRDAYPHADLDWEGLYPLDHCPAPSLAAVLDALPPYPFDDTHRYWHNQSSCAALDTEEDVRAMVDAAVASVVGRPVSVSETLVADAGLDSLGAVELKNILETRSGVPLSATLAFNYPTVTDLSAHVWREVVRGRRGGDGGGGESRLRESEEKKKEKEEGEEREEKEGWRKRLSEEGVPSPSSPPSTPDVSPEHGEGPSAAKPCRSEPGLGIAVVGMGCRFAGAARDVESLWQCLMSGEDLMRCVPGERWESSPEAKTGKGYWMEGVDMFDAGRFGISGSEAEYMDPQQRVVLEVCAETLADAGVEAESLAESETGVFLGVTNNDYAKVVGEYERGRSGERGEGSVYSGTGVAASVLAGRVSYVFGLRGPSMSIDTACSSSLVAVNSACHSLRGGRCDRALAGGVNIILTSDTSDALSRMGVLSESGRCHSFGSSADGYARGDGCGVVMLMRVEDAVKEGRHIYGVIRGSAVNQDGRSGALTAPHGPSQVRVIQRALECGGVSPEEVEYVESHGTGTLLGDPVEAEALCEALGVGVGVGVGVGGERRSVWLGALKTNIGHTEAAAGVAGLIKALCVLERGVLPGNRHMEDGASVNPHLRRGRVGVDEEEEEEAREGVVISSGLRFPVKVGGVHVPGIRVAGVSSFGWSGTNAHVVVSRWEGVGGGGRDAVCRSSSLDWSRRRSYWLGTRLPPPLPSPLLDSTDCPPSSSLSFSSLLHSRVMGDVLGTRVRRRLVLSLRLATSLPALHRPHFFPTPCAAPSP